MRTQKHIKCSVMVINYDIMIRMEILLLREEEPVEALEVLTSTALILEIYLETYSVICLEVAEAAGQAMAL